MSALIGHSNGIQDGAAPSKVIQDYVAGGIILTARGPHPVRLSFSQAKTISRWFLDWDRKSKIEISVPITDREKIYVKQVKLLNQLWLEIGKCRQLLAAPSSEQSSDQAINYVLERALLTPMEMAAKVREWMKIGEEAPQYAGQVHPPQTQKEASLR